MALFKSDNVQAAERALRGEYVRPAELLALSNRLKAERKFGHARRILGLARRDRSVDAAPELKLVLGQQHALCTFKDPDLPRDERLDRALEILQDVDPLRKTRNQETLGLAGSIYKQKWGVDGQRDNLETSLAFYLRGYHEGAAQDYGYTGINAAFVLDLLADQEPPAAEEAISGSDSGTPRRARARQIRDELVTVLTSLPTLPGKAFLTTQWWFLVTVGEAFYGLERYEEALDWLRQAAALPGIVEWEFEATARQLASIARMQAEESGSAAELTGSEAWKTLEAFLANYAAGVRTAFIGKVGLALSGGGFRASFFHIGVLAKLAELDILRHVETLSCVSGGSIIGAHYYLEVRRMMQARLDAEITREDYVAIVQRIEYDFLAGVQRNIRTRVAAEFSTNLKMLFSPRYSRTLRAGELFESEIFARAGKSGDRRELWLNELYIVPRGEPENFAPKNQNWRRRAKVPILVLNATTLNTGHVWQFTTKWMGEPPGSIDTEVDGARRLRRVYYDDAPAQLRAIRLGHAVAASACVPGIFDPVPLAGLYPNMAVRLVDGGVHDNQGVGGLLEQDCTVLLVSDASGQMPVEADPGAGIMGVPLRANSILMARVREAQYHELGARRRSRLVRDVVFVHMKRDLDEDPVDWVDCKDPHEASDEARPRERRGPLTRFGIRKDVQARLAQIRTDLDSFSDLEARALMVSGYRMMQHELTGRLEISEQPKSLGAPWRFLEVEGLMAQANPGLMRAIEVGKCTSFKIWRLSRPLRQASLVLGAACAGALAWWCWSKWTSNVATLQVGHFVSATALLLLILLLGKVAIGGARIGDTLGRVALGLLMIGPGWILARIHLWFFDPLYMRWYRSHLDPPHAAADFSSEVERPAA